MKNSVCSTDGTTHRASQVPPKYKWLLVFQLQQQPRTCAKAFINLPGLFKRLNSLLFLGFLLPNRIFQKIKISQEPSIVGNFCWNEGVIKGFWTFTYGQISLQKFFHFHNFFYTSKYLNVINHRFGQMGSKTY